jgi:flagellar basal body rod protein FlgG
MRLAFLLLFSVVTAAASGKPPGNGDHQLIETNREEDFAISGNGFFVERLPAKLGGGIAYTRVGQMYISSSGHLVVLDVSGLELLPSITFPRGITDLEVDGDGTVRARMDSRAGMVTVGRIFLATFEHPDALAVYPPTQHAFFATPAAGNRRICYPTENGAGSLLQGALEQHQREAGRIALNRVQTNRDMDVAIDGDGFFAVKLPPDQGGGTGYTRFGHFTVGKRGQLELGNAGCAAVMPPLFLPNSTTDVDIDPAGNVKVSVAGRPQAKVIGQFQVFEFANPNELARSATDPELRLPTDGSGPAVAVQPGSGSSSLEQGYLQEPIDAGK